MSEIPQVGSRHQHSKHGEVYVSSVSKRGRGYQVNYSTAIISNDGEIKTGEPQRDRLKDWQRATA